MKKRWRSFIKKIIYKNKSDSSTYIKYLRKQGCKIGKGCFFYSPQNTIIDETSLQFIQLGDMVQIAQGVIILGHDYSYSVLGNVFYDLPRPQKKTIIGSNVFIGMNAIILNGVTIGDNVIIGAGAVVTKDCSAMGVYAGNPAKYICSLEQYYNKCCLEFKSSAATWFERKDEIVGPYSTFFYGKGEIIGGIGLDEKNIPKVKSKMKKWEKYDNIKQLLND